jgi:hypothetical protein
MPTFGLPEDSSLPLLARHMNGEDIDYICSETHIVLDSAESLAFDLNTQKRHKTFVSSREQVVLVTDNTAPVQLQQRRGWSDLWQYRWRLLSLRTYRTNPVDMTHCLLGIHR